MSAVSVPGSLAGVFGAMVSERDVTDVLRQLLDACARVYPAAAAALLVSDEQAGLELLSATSHRAEELELLQHQHQRGPCVDALASDGTVVVAGRDDLDQRWGGIGTEIADAGFDGVHAYPMRWRGRVIGALNLFLKGEPDDALERRVLGQMIADIAVLVLVTADDSPTDQLHARVHDALVARTTIEQAKGVIAYQQGLSPGAAYDELVARAGRTGVTITAAAVAVIAEAGPGPRPPG